MCAYVYLCINGRKRCWREKLVAAHPKILPTPSYVLTETPYTHTHIHTYTLSSKCQVLNSQLHFLEAKFIPWSLGPEENWGLWETSPPSSERKRMTEEKPSFSAYETHAENLKPGAVAASWPSCHDWLKRESRHREEAEGGGESLVLRHGWHDRTDMVLDFICEIVNISIQKSLNFFCGSKLSWLREQ